MAFTDPILAGEELNRTGIRSANYVPGVSGWRIANNGAAEFDNIGVRGTLWTPQIILNGRDLIEICNDKALGLTSFMRGYPVVSTTTEAQIMLTEWQDVPGRQYEMMLANVTNDLAGTKNCEFVMRYTEGKGTFPYPDNSSPIVATSGRLSQYELANIRAYHEATTDNLLRIRVSILSYSGTVRSLAPGGGCHLGIYDVGRSRAMVGTSGASNPVKTLKEWTITANESRTYNGDQSLRTDQYATTLVAGDWSNGRGNQRAWFTFSASDVSTKLDDLMNVPASDVVIAELRLAPFQYSSLTDDGYLSIGFHNAIGGLGGGGEQSSGIPNVYRPYVSGTGPKWIGLMGGGVPSNFLDSMRDGSLNGFMVGNTFSGSAYCIVCEGTGGWTNYPQLHMKYWK